MALFSFQGERMNCDGNIYYLSGNTGILAKNMGKAILCQFPGASFKEETIPFVRTRKDALLAREKILKESVNTSAVVISTLLDNSLNDLFCLPGIHLLTILESSIQRVEGILGKKALWKTGHPRHDESIIDKRVNAIHYSISHDDGALTDDYGEADLILIGVSRAGKTPVSIYLATQMGMKTANYPLVGDDLLYGMLPETIISNREKVIGLTIAADILHAFREKRFPGSDYALPATCEREITQATRLFESYALPVVFSDRHSIEETATQVARKRDLKKWPLI